jgi:hypothetical protein
MRCEYGGDKNLTVLLGMKDKQKTRKFKLFVVYLVVHNSAKSNLILFLSRISATSFFLDESDETQ